ncbi:hypothetical protein [Urechidicola croceus]|uniref:EF-hand domain-containing protein n=1 Tax=Urechidicola croceus TaxID=1850246 RepID=A0A1D8P4T2_9FLAO|nr:hypothetical protein [Urechidicola croceus]AOW19575.1 hypothetical protein LPB138_02280 [Urechidicola croceus]
MKKILLLISCISLLSCDDGNFDSAVLDFEAQNIQNCGEFVFFKINSNESLMIELSSSDSAQEFFLTETEGDTYSLAQTGNNIISYRTFNEDVSADYFCQAIPPATPTINKEWLGSAELFITNTVINDDLDGVEELDLELDTDSDEVPDYLDNDDDGDGILTKNELDENGDPIDTDSDGISNHLDSDDDNDGILTINESLTDSDNDPLSIPDYLDDNTSEPLDSPRTAIRDGYTATFSMNFTLNNLILENENSDSLIFETYNYGTYTNSYSIDLN